MTDALLSPEQCRAARGLLGLSQSRLCEIAGLTIKSLSDFESGKTNPYARTLARIRAALEGERVLFIGGDGGGDGVRLKTRVWRLEPLDLAEANWRASIHKGDAIVRAAGERRARALATRAFAIATDKPSTANPWSRSAGCVTCIPMEGPDYPQDGPEAILSPAEYDDNWNAGHKAMSRLRLVFMGSPDFAVPVLAALIKAGHEVTCVYCQPPRPAGRGLKERPVPVHAFAAGRGLKVLTPKSLEGGAEQAAIAGHGADVCVVAAYGLILPKAVIEAPRLGCLNVHPSLLPRWRGAAPIQRAILAGDGETGVTIMQMDEGLDTGPILLAESMAIPEGATAGRLHDALSAMGARLILKALDGLGEGRLAPVPQPADGVTFAGKLDRAEGRLDWSRPAVELERAVRAFDPSPGAWFDHKGRRIKVLAAEVVEGRANAAPGAVLDDRLAIACGEGALRLVRVQRPGKGPIDAEAFLRGNPLPAGSEL